MFFGQGRPLLWAGARLCQPLPIAVHGMSMLQAALDMHHCGLSMPSCQLCTSIKYEKHGAFLICRKIEQNLRIPLELYHFSKGISSQVQAKKVKQIPNAEQRLHFIGSHMPMPLICLATRQQGNRASHYAAIRSNSDSGKHLQHTLEVRM